MKEEMRRDPSVFLIGEDIGAYGGLFRVTRNLMDEFGGSRVIDTPISEQGFVGMAVGAAMVGMRPIIELMYMDFFLVCADQIFNQAAKMHYMTGGLVHVPLVLRGQHGGGKRYVRNDPARVGVLMESAHAILAGLDPSDEIGFAMAAGKLWGVHLNDQNGLKFDQDRAFGSVDLRRAFNQVRVLEQNHFAHMGMVGLDVKALRTQPADLATKHLRNSLQMFLRLVELVRTLDVQRMDELIAARDYEELDWLILSHLTGQ